MSGLPTIPEYFKTYINPNIDLEVTPSIPCPLHGEKEGRSFSYSEQLGKWRCFGKCKCGGDVIALHQKYRNLPSREEAKAQLQQMYYVKQDTFTFTLHRPEVDKEKVRFSIAYNKAIRTATTPEKWLQLDMILSECPPDISKLEVFSNGN